MPTKKTASLREKELPYKADITRALTLMILVVGVLILGFVFGVDKPFFAAAVWACARRL